MVEFSRMFAMSAFEGLRTLRLHLLEYPNTELAESIDLIRRVNSEGATHDYEAALHLHASVIAEAPPNEAIIFYQHCIEASINLQPIWGRIITLGRKKFTQKLSVNEQQCFTEAGLLEDPPSASIIAWWDRASARLRLQVDQEKMTQARAAEQMTIDFELERLGRIGIALTPEWTSIEDNTAGYDVHSYDLNVGAATPIARLIEVKSTIASPMRFILTRHEWDTAVKYGDAYHFHIWDMRNNRLYQKTVIDIAPHIPTDNEDGSWKNVVIPITA